MNKCRCRATISGVLILLIIFSLALVAYAADPVTEAVTAPATKSVIEATVVTEPAIEATIEPEEELVTEAVTAPATESVIETTTAVTEPAIEATIEPEEEAQLLEGDVNGDGMITIADARLIARAFKGIDTLESGQMEQADLNDSGSIGKNDAEAVAEMAASVETITQ